MTIALPIAACGDNWTPTGSTANGVFPSEAFLGRRARVEISGVATHWDAATTVDFGAGVDVGDIAIASESTVFVDIFVDPGAAPGLHDVTITDGPQVLVLAQAFLVQPPIALHFDGTVAQGSVALFSIVNHDFDAPFDTSSFQDSAFDPPIYINTHISAPEGVTFEIDEVTPYTITGQVLADVDAVHAGPVEVISGAGAAEVRSPLGSSITIVERTAVPLAPGATTDTLARPFDSNLYSFAPATSPHLAQFAVSSTTTTAAPRIAVLPASGHFADLLARQVSRSTQVAASPSYYLVYFDPRGTANYSFTLAAASTALPPLAELEPNGDAAQAQPHSAPMLVTGGALASQADEDWFAIAVGAADIGRHVRVITTGADPMTDTLVDVRDASLASLGGPSSDANFHEDFTSGAIAAAGTYYVVIGASQTMFFQPAHNTYAAAIFLE